MSKRIWRSGRLLAVACGFVLCVGDARAETLLDAFRDAYFYNPSIEAERAGLRALGETVPIAEAGRLPVLALSGSMGLNRSVANPGSRDSTTNPLSLSFTGSVPLYDGGAAANAVSEARANVDAAYANLAATEQDTLLSAATAFFDVLRDKEIRDLSRENVAILREQLDASEARFEVGEVTITDVTQAKTSLAAANANLIQAEGQLRASAESYRAVVGRLPGALDPPDRLPALPENRAAAETEAEAGHPSIRATRSAERAAIYAIRSAMAGMAPTVDLGASLSGSVTDLGEDGSSASAGLTLSLNAPVYQGGLTDARIRQARHAASQRRAQHHAAIRRVREALNRAWLSLTTARGAIEAGEERVRAAQIAYEGVREELLVGSRATIDLLNAEQERLNARIALVRSVRDYNVAAYGVLSAMGRLDPENLGFEPVREPGAGLHGVEPANPRALPIGPSTAWRFPWRP